MLQPNHLVLYVDNPEDSGRFYARLLESQPVQSLPGFVLFVLPSGLKLGLWARNTAQPRPAAFPGGSEICFQVESAPLVDATHADWSERGISIAQPPTDLGFGRTFLALDPDGHRLRVYALAG